MSDSEKKDTIFYAVDMTILAFEQANKRLFALCVLLIVLLLGSNIGWLIYENQFEDVVETNEVSQDIDTGDGDITVVGVGDISYGESSANGKENN